MFYVLSNKIKFNCPDQSFSQQNDVKIKWTIEAKSTPKRSYLIHFIIQSVEYKVTINNITVHNI